MKKKIKTINNKQFKATTTSGVEVKGEYEGNGDSGKVLIFSHGFGVTRDSHGMFNQLGDAIKDEFLVVRFDYTKTLKDEKSRFLYPYSTQKQMLKAVIENIVNKFNVLDLNLLGHSMGGIIIGMLSPDNIQKTILVASPIASPYEQMKEYFSQREGTDINEDSESRLPRSDGSVSILDKDFWPEMEQVNPKKLYLALSKKTELYYVRALEDHGIGEQDFRSKKKSENISYLELHGDHDFSGDDRENWVKKMAEIIKG